MAIKYYNITDTSDNHLETLKGVLESVAADYFTSFELSVDKFTLTCYDGENPLLVFTMATGCKSFKATINGDGTTKSLSGSTTNVSVCMRIATTGCGVGLKFKYNNAVKTYGIFITKSKSNKTAIFADWYEATGLNSSDNNCGYCVTSESGNTNKVSLICGYSTAYVPIGDLTVLAPIVVSGTTDYCPNLFVMVNSQYYGTEGIIDIDGVKYLSNGYYILKDK